MKPRAALILLLLVISATAVILAVKPSRHEAAPATEAGSLLDPGLSLSPDIGASADTNSPNALASVFAAGPGAGALSNDAASPAAPPATHGPDSVQQRILDLGELAAKHDPDSLSAILEELSNPDPAIRKAAVEAAVQFGDRSAVPRLREVAAIAQDNLERSNILSAIDALDLPSLDEFLKAHKKAEPPETPATAEIPPSGSNTPAADSK
jgi:hypothetical protein